MDSSALQPHWQSPDGRVSLFHADCMEVLPILCRAIPDQQYVTVVTDPPYGMDYAGETWDKSCGWDWLRPCLRFADCVAFTICHTHQWHYPEPDWVACWYQQGSTKRSVWGGFSHWCPILIYGTPRREWWPVDVIKTNSCHRAGTPEWHSCAKPLKLFSDLIFATSDGDSVVVDPFAGSFQSAIAAIRAGRRYIGIEQNPAYFEGGQQRVEEELASMLPVHAQEEDEQQGELLAQPQE